MSLYQKSVSRPIMTGLIYVAVIIIGIFSLTKLSWYSPCTPGPAPKI